MKIIKKWTKWQDAARQTDPTYFYGDTGSVPFIYDNEIILYAKKHGKSTGVFKNGKFIESIPDDDPSKTLHADIAEVFPDDAGKISKAWYKVTHGRIGPSKQEINFMMPFSSAKGKDEEAEVKKIVRALKKVNLLKSGPYKVGVFKETEWLFYKVEKDDLTGNTRGLSTHDIMRDRIYNRLGLESRMIDFVNLLKEELEC